MRGCVRGGYDTEAWEIQQSLDPSYNPIVHHIPLYTYSIPLTVMHIFALSEIFALSGHEKARSWRFQKTTIKTIR